MINPEQGYTSVVFDCDSTLCEIEGIDVLAGEHADEIARLTDLAMTGRIPLEEVYGRRLDIIRPDRRQVEALGDSYVAALVEDAVETIAALRWLGKQVRIVSGGLLPPILGLAGALGIRPEEVAAVGVEFRPDGAYAEYDRGSPLARSGGKAEVIRAWGLPRPVLLVGDGATDAEAKPVVDAFAAYLGVASRPEVAREGDFVLPARSLAPVLAIAASPKDRQRLAGSEWAALLARGDELAGPSAAPGAADRT